MTQEEIVRIAREAGLALTDHGHPEGYAMFCERLERFAALVAAHEREACAKVCEELDNHFDYTIAARQCAAAIRARGENGTA